LLEPTRG